MASGPQLSVVIPCYNSRDTITEAVASALAQHDVPVEVIVVDDGSTDGSRDAVADTGQLSRIQWITQANQGVSAARNRGLAAAMGTYLCFLDADDILEPSFGAEMIRCLQSRAGRFAYCDYRYFTDEPGRPTIAIRYPTPEGRVAGRMLSENFIPTPGAVLLDRTLLQSHKFDPVRQGTEDWWLWMQLCLDEPVYFHPQCLVHIRVRPTSLGRQKSAMIRETAELFGAATELVATRGDVLSDQEKARFHYRAAAAMVDAGRARDAARHWAFATRHGLDVSRHSKLLGRSALAAAGWLRSVERLLWRRRVGR